MALCVWSCHTPHKPWQACDALRAASCNVVQTIWLEWVALCSVDHCGLLLLV